MQINFLKYFLLLCFFFFTSAHTQAQQRNAVLEKADHLNFDQKANETFLDLDVQDLIKIMDNYLGMIVLFVKVFVIENKLKINSHLNREEIPQENNELLQSLLRWKLNNSAYAIAKVAIKDLESIPNRLKPERLPSLVFFTEKKKIVYQGELQNEKCTTWIQRIKSRETESLKNQVTSPLYSEYLRSKGDFEEFMLTDKSPKLIAFYTSNMLEEIKMLKSLVTMGVLLELGIYQVAFCLEDCLIPSYKEYEFERPSLVLFRNLPDVSEIATLRNALNNDSAIIEFCNKEAIPSVISLNEATSRFLFLGFAQLHIILVVNNQTENSPALQDFKRSAEFNRKYEAYQDRIIHSVYNVDTGSSKLNEILDITNEGQTLARPQLLALNVTDEQFLKYEYKKSSISFENLREFIIQFRNHELHKHLASEPIPENCENCKVEKIVGANFQSRVIDSSHNFLVLFCGNTPEWPECLYSFKILEFIAENSGTTESSLKFGYLNTDKNEIDFEYSSETPVVILFQKGLGKKVHELPAPHTVEKLTEWLSGYLPNLKFVLDDKKIKQFEDEKLSTKEKEKYEIIKGIDKDGKRMIKEEEERIKINQENEYSSKYIDL